MSTVYDYDLHDLGQSAFQSFQRQALSEQSLRDAPVSPSPAPGAPSTPTVSRPTGGGALKKLVVGVAVAGLIGGVLYLGGRALPSRKD